ncbi:GGDEF domain-containing protein [Actinosynnema sp. NPDC020468]|uniref:GGDEF domain-containing protein n=1 Tax=Actinosynnema sp. NPDC020468 TaxID=3154488 RepID=UPI0033FB7A23
MTALRPDVAEPDRDGPADVAQAEGNGLVQLHESIATLLASRGQWRQAYQHLRSAFDLACADQDEQPKIPEQLRREVDRLRREHAEAREQSLRDSLTDSYNRRYLDQRLVDLESGRGASTPGLAIALIDLDWFKQVNDTFGHLLGDRVLQRVVELLQEDLPKGGFCARYGGEEFVLVLPEVDVTTAVEIAEAARLRVERHAWQSLAPGLRVTVSVGLACESDGEDPAARAPVAPEQQLLRADSLLYTAKQSGRNAVAYREGGRVRLAGAASGRRGIAESRVAGY